MQGTRLETTQIELCHTSLSSSPQEVYRTASMRLNIVSPDLSGECPLVLLGLFQKWGMMNSWRDGAQAHGRGSWGAALGGGEEGPPRCQYPE
jgi:hypothetical protein